MTFASVAQATTITVNTNADPAGSGVCLDGGQCSLRQAVGAASNGDTIQLGSDMYSLTQGTTIFISKSLTIQGNGVGSTSIDGLQNKNPSGKWTRLFRTDRGTVWIQDLSLTHSYDESDEAFQGCSPCSTNQANGGGALFNNGATVNLTRVAFTDNYSSATPLGGAVSNGAGTLNMTDVSFTRNAAGAGGALFTRNGTVTGTGVTFEDDSTTASLGGAAYFWGGTVTLTNTTVVRSGGYNGTGAIVNGGASVTLINDTLSDNGSDLRTDSFATTTVKNTILGTGPSGGVACDPSGRPDSLFNQTSGNAITSDGGNNIDQGQSCNLTGSGDMSNTDPLLAPIGDNGGPTRTDALQTGSPAIDAGNDLTCAATDQRGVSRPQGPHCDVGAYEAVPPSPPPPSTSPQASTSPPASTAPPTISGTPRSGQQLTCSNGTWANSPTTFAYQWNRDGSATAGATAATYTVAGGDVGHQLTCTVAASNADGSSSKTSSGVVATAVPAAITTQPQVNSSEGARFAGSVNPQGLPTTAYFEYGLDPQYGTTPGEGLYTQKTTAQPVGAGFQARAVSAPAQGLVPNAMYHVRVVATNIAGTTYGPDVTFRTAKDRANPPPPVLGKAVDVTVVSGVVLIKAPPGKKLAGDRASAAALTKGQGFIPLTEPRQIPTGSQIDARRGTLAITAATGTPKKTQTGTFNGGLFKVTQARLGLNKGLTTLSLLEGVFRGAPTYANCGNATAADGSPTAHQALSSRILQTLRARDNHGRFATRGRYSAATVRGTQWDTTDRCDGTLTVVHRGTVAVSDFVRHITVLVHAGHQYLAKAPAKGRRK